MHRTTVRLEMPSLSVALARHVRDDDMARRPGLPVATLNGVWQPVRQVIRKLAVVMVLLEHVSHSCIGG